MDETLLPHPTFNTRMFHTEAEAADWIDQQPAEPSLVAYHHDAEQLWKVTTAANFQADAYWHGSPADLDDDLDG